jgi:2-polyprenyl-6-hydroxyphenyl methylase/3-demethylubiquinone-9 3-methyltransferase
MDYTYHNYSQADPPHQALYLADIEKVLRCANARLVLDAGCGDGNFTASLAEAGFQMFGVDLSEGGIALAQARYPAISFVRASVYDDFLTAFSIATPFDAIVSVEVIEHLYSPRTFIKRAHAALKPGGLLIVTTPYWGYLKNLLLALTSRIDRALTALWEGGHIKHWSFATLSELGRRYGFKFESFHGTKGRPPFLWKGMIMVFRKPDGR